MKQQHCSHAPQERGQLCVAMRVEWCDRGSVQMVLVHHVGHIAWRGCSWDFISSVLKVGRGVFWFRRGCIAYAESISAIGNCHMHEEHCAAQKWVSAEL